MAGPRSTVPDPFRRRAHGRGKTAESIAVWRLRLAGYRILARRYACPAGEIDIVARRLSRLAVVEVKARASIATAAEAITPRQWRRIARAAEHFLAGRPALAALDLTFDVVLIAPWRWPRHLPDAWRPA